MVLGEQATPTLLPRAPGQIFTLGVTIEDVTPLRFAPWQRE